MANADLGVNTYMDVVDKRKVQGASTQPIATPANYASISAMRTRLLAIGGVYTAAYLDVMTKNDMIYALRLSDDSAGI
ncbi:MAG TPA: hypothetical protein VIY48_21285 [Candidatus Paceibacterota bacterium]